MGKPVGADTSQADGYGEFKAEKESDLHQIQVGDEQVLGVFVRHSAWFDGCRVGA